MVLIGRVRFFLYVTCCMVAQISLAQPSSLPGVTLEDFFTAAINFSPELQISKESLNISAARRKAANGQLLPQISAGANLSENRLNRLDRINNYDGSRYALTLSQTLFDWQQFEARKQSYFAEDGQEQEYYYQLGLVLTEVAERYFGVLQAEDALESIESEIDAITNQVDQIQSLYDRQLTQITDLYQGQASLAAVEADRLSLETDLALSKEALRSLAGLEVGPLYRLEESADIPLLEFSLDYYVDRSREQNHQIQAREYVLKASEAAVSASKGAFMPRVSFIAQRQDSNVGFDNLPINKTDTTYFGVNLTIPIYAGGRNSAAASEAISRRSIAESELRAMQLQVRASVRSAYLQVQSSETRTNAARALLESTSLAAQAMQQGFDLGTVTSVDVLNSLRDQYRAERDLQRTRYDHVTFLLLLKRETGTLSAEDLLEVGGWLTPEPL